MASAHSGHGTLETPPGHDSCVLCDAALQDLVPTDDLSAVSVDVFLDALDEVALQALLVGNLQLAHSRLHSRRGLPLVFERLVSAKMQIFSRE